MDGVSTVLAFLLLFALATVVRLTFLLEVSDAKAKRWKKLAKIYKGRWQRLHQEPDDADWWKEGKRDE